MQTIFSPAPSKCRCKPKTASFFRTGYNFIPNPDDVQKVDPLELQSAMTKSPAEAVQYLRAAIPEGHALELDQFIKETHNSLEGHRHSETLVRKLV